jgi:hypothetical protein
MRRFPTAALLAVLAAAPALAGAAPAATCHCYRDRSFDPERPAAADPYLLATTRSSLLSASYGISKAALVTAVMGGTQPDALWIAYWAGGRAARDPDALLEAAKAGRAWKDVLAGAGRLGPAFEAALARGAADEELAAIAVDDVLVSRAGADGGAVRALRIGRASSGETILATFLARKTAVPAPQLLERVRSGGATWGSLLVEAGLAPGALDAFVRAAVR